MLTEPRRLVAGHRLEELIGIGERANVYRATSTTIGGRSQVVVKVCSAGSSAPGRDAECRVLAERPIAAMPRLIDAVTTTEGELVIVMSLCRGRTLRSLRSREPATHPSTRRGRSPTPARGSAFTALVAELHAEGVAHGSLDSDAVLIDESGALSLVGFRSARRRGEPGFEVALAADQRAVRRLAAAVEALGSPAVRDLEEPIETSRPPALGYPIDAIEPDKTPALRHPVDAVGARAVRDTRMAHHSSTARASDPIAGSSGGGDRDAWDWPQESEALIQPPEPALVEVLEPAALAVRESWLALRSLFRSRSARALAPRRRRILVVGGASLLTAVVVACVLLPTPEPGPSSAGSALSSSSLASSPVPSSPATVPVSPAAQQSQANAGSDDPMVAVMALLDQRGTCLVGHDLGCLDQVDQWGSPALLADRELARPTGSDEGASPDPLATITDLGLVQRLGAAAILHAVSRDDDSTTKKPVSLLVMRNETGWRIRWYDSG